MQKPVVKIVDRKAPVALRRVLVTSVMPGNMRCSLETNEQITLRTWRQKGLWGWGRERDDVACVVVARYVLWVVERDWWARHYTGRVAVTSYGAATQAVSGCTNFAHSVWTASANGAAVNS